MFKKLILGGLLVTLIGILVAGGVIRTLDKTGQVAEARSLQELGRGNGRGAGNTELQNSNPFDLGNLIEKVAGAFGNGAAQETVAQGQGLGTTGERLYPNYETAPDTWVQVEGIVVQAPELGRDLLVQTADGQEILVGTGPEYMASQGFRLQIGEQIQIKGYWEDDELKASQITRLRDGQTIALRDEYGRPSWAGAGRNQTAAGSQGRDNATEEGLGAGQGAGNSSGGGRGAGQGAGQGAGDSVGDGLGQGQAEVTEWLTFQGSVTSVNSSELIAILSGGEQISLYGRPWWFIQEQGGVYQVGDQVTIVGFYEAGELEVGQIVNNTTGQSISVRDENGRPLWAGQGRGNS